MLAELPASGFSLFLSGGPIAEQSYRDLAALTGPRLGADQGDASEHRSVDWSRVDIYLGDERCVPPDDPDSNHRMVAEVLLDAGGTGSIGSPHVPIRSSRSGRCRLPTGDRVTGPIRPGPPRDWGRTATAPPSSRTRRPWPSTTPTSWWQPTGTLTPSIPTTGSPSPCPASPGRPWRYSPSRERRSNRRWQAWWAVTTCRPPGSPPRGPVVGRRRRGR